MPRSTVSDLTGRVLAGRYRLLAWIGAGSSGRVYVADDVRLRRRVAVKVLHAALSDDSGFLRRFRTEAQLAAALHHPNIMAVYDWGEDEVPFMVLELLVGGSLRGVLDHGTLLSPSQAGHVGRGVASALEYAHSRGLVHRDIKPANLLFDEHGIVRVADFGLARALAEASWTEPAGTVLGTARYAAPEQGTAMRLDGRADLYALGLVIVESVTGAVPLVADTPLGTLGLRAQRSVTAPAQLRSLGPVVERAGHSDPDQRYPDAATMGAALDDAIRVLPPPGPLVLAGLGEMADDPHPTQISGQREDWIFDQDAPLDPVIVKAPPKMERGRNIAPFLVATVLVLALVGIAFALASPTTGTRVPIPNLVGLNQSAARVTTNNAGLLPKFVERFIDDPKGLIVEQQPGAGAFQSQGGKVTLVVSKGPRPVALPNVVGAPLPAAQAALEQAQFVVTSELQYHETAPKNTVMSTVPDGKAAPFSTVHLVVSNGPVPRTVPNVAGKTFAEASKALGGQQLGAIQGDEFSDTVAAGTVIRTDPPAGQKAARDSKVTVVVSKGPDLVVVPKFRGLTIDQASAAATAAGVQVQAQGVFNGGRAVRAQDPAVGTQVKRGTVVTIFF